MAKRNQHVFETRESELEAKHADPSAWIALDTVYIADASGARRAARLCGRQRGDRTAEVSRTFAIVRHRPHAHNKDVERSLGSAPGFGMGDCGRRYSLALLALLDALAAEPPRSPLATGSRLEDVRATAFFVAGAAAAEQPDLSLIDRAVERADRRLAELRVPLQATGYRAARDALRRMVVPHSEARTGGAP